MNPVQRTIDDAFALSALRGSLESRCRQAGFAALAMTTYTLLTALVLSSNALFSRLAGWLTVCTSMLLVRFVYSRRVRQRLDHTWAELRRMDLGFRAVSLVSQTAVGAGIWVIAGQDTLSSAYIVTLFIMLYGVGTIINLAHDFATVKITLPVLLAQPMVYWLMRGSAGLLIALILAGLGFMMLSLAGNSHRSFNESLRIRFEKDQLLRQLEAQQRATASALAAAEAANRSKSFFMAAASHDLRQPLFAVSILHDALALQTLRPEAAQLLQQQGIALKATSALFDNLLDLSKFESGVIRPQFVRVGLAGLMDELEAEFAPQCQARGLYLRVVPDLPDVHSDYELLGRLLRNLIGNALRYTREGGIRVDFETGADHVIVAVSDSGIGIAQQDQERIFGEFVQVSNPRRAREGGAGLGLAIVRHIGLLLKHTIQLSSAPGVGTTVRVTLPLLQSLEPATASSVTAAPLVGSAPHTGRVAWIVEDDPLVRDAIAAYLTQRGCRCIAAASEAELKLPRAPSDAPDFVILDDMLGTGASGLDIARQLLASVPGRRILLATGTADPARWQQLQSIGVRVERKPVAGAMLDAWLSEAARS
jgi:two-component system, sensor histidine kinase